MMETPQLDLTSELLGVFNGTGGCGSSESAEEGLDLKYDITSKPTNQYLSNPRRAKNAIGQHRRTITKRTRFPLKWNHVCSFKDPTEAESFIHSFEGYSWRKGCNNKTSYGLKAYYICRESPVCKVMSLLHYDNKAKQVVVYRSDREHYHGLATNNGSSSVPAQNGTVTVTNAAETSSASSIPGNSGQTSHFHGDGKSTRRSRTPGSGINGTTPESEVIKRKSGGGRRLGLSDETIAIIHELFALDSRIKPSQVQEELKRNGIPLLQNYHINNFLVKLRKQSRLSEAESGELLQPPPRQSSRNQRQQLLMHYKYMAQQGDDENGVGNEQEEYYSDDDNYNSSTTDTWFGNNPMSMVDINLKNQFDDDENGDGEDTEDDLMDGDRDELFGSGPGNGNGNTDGDDYDESGLVEGENDSVSVTISTGHNSNSKQTNLFPVLSSAVRRTSTNSASSSGALPSTKISSSGFRNNQSEVVSTSNISRPRKRNFYFRDETTKDGDDVLPNEDNIKGIIVQHIIDNYSNRDMLHIREELQTLKDMKKFRSLNRLLSFTAGFLQDSFLDVAYASTGTGSSGTPIAASK